MSESSQVRLAAKYSALEAITGNKPSALRSLLLDAGGVQAAFAQGLQAPNANELERIYEQALHTLESLRNVRILHKDDPDYPLQLQSWADRPEFLYIAGNASKLSMRGVSVVGSRAASEFGKGRAERISRALVKHGYSVVSGLALGIDSVAHGSAIKAGGHTTAVIGTPINKYYPKENKQLQDLIAETGTLVSQFSPIRPTQRLNFPQRNEVMGMLSVATVIVEAGETSGALIQARHCLRHGKQLFIMQNQIDRSDLTWPKEFLKKGAVALKNEEDLFLGLNKSSSTGHPPATQLTLI